MILKVLVTLLSCSLCTAWPILQQYNPSQPMRPRSVLVSCGDNVTEIVTPHQPSQLYMNVQSLSPGCVIHWRIAIQNSGIEHFGFEVTGSVDINDPANNNECASSGLTVTDGDIGEEGSDFISTNYCGQEPVHFVTTQDSLNLQLRVGGNGASGSGFNITLTPLYECGGVITSDTIITSPGFPQMYPTDISCLWEVKVDIGSKAELLCSVFKLPERRGRRCRHFLLDEISGKTTNFCGTELQGAEHKRTYTAGDIVLYFRSNSKKFSGSEGFKCSITYQASEDARQVLLQALL